MSTKAAQRDKLITRHVHKIFWRSIFDTKFYLGITLLTHAPAFFMMNILVPFQVAYALQAIILRHFNLLPHYVFLIITITIIANIILALGTWAFNRNGTEAGIYVQREVFENYLSKDFEFYGNNYIGALGTQASNLRQALLDYNRIALFDVPKVVVIISAGLIVIADKSILLALISLACMLSVFVFTILSSKYRLTYRRRVSQASSTLAGVLGDALSHATVVKSFVNEKYEIRRLNVALKKWEKAQLKSWDLFTPANFGRNILLAITMSVLLLVSSHLYKDGAISIAVITLVQLYVIRLINTTIDIAEIIKQYESIMSASYEPVATMMIEQSVKDPVSPLKLTKNNVPKITFDNVSYRYPEMTEKNHAIKDFNLVVDGGKKIGVVGYSGSGKTTLTKLLLRFMDTDSGSIYIDGINIKDITQENLRNFVAYVPQEPLLFHRSIKENISYANPDATDEEVIEASKLAFVDEFVKDLPKGYDTMVGERGVKLSGGQRQRVAIARALLKGAPVLVLDEATSALDSQSEHYIQKALNELMKNRTSIVIAHRLSTIQKMDEIVVMNEGRIVQVGSHSELLKQTDKIYAKLWSHQSGGYIEEQ